MLGELNTDVGQTYEPQDKQVTVILVSFGMVDLLGYLRDWMRFRYMQTWFQV